MNRVGHCCGLGRLKVNKWHRSHLHSSAASTAAALTGTFETRHRGARTLSFPNPPTTTSTTATTITRYQPTRPFSSSTFNMAETKWTAPVVRKTFLEFFESKGHTQGESTELAWRGNFGERNKSICELWPQSRTRLVRRWLGDVKWFIELL